MNKAFVFVVCGGEEHINTLHFSLNALRRLSDYPIIILTDSNRNEKVIEHDQVIDIKTPEHLNHHQASIYLKTGIHKFLPAGRLYCYLDSDVVATDRLVNEIFEHKKSVINFASDHCKVQKFSPYAIKCSCLSDNERERKELSGILNRYNAQLEIKDTILLQKQKSLIRKFDSIKTNKFKYLLISARFLLSPVKFKLDEDTYYHRWKKVWMDSSGEVILYTRPRRLISTIERHTKWRWDRKNSKWISPAGKDIDNLICDHLTGYINDKFGVDVKIKNWQHWNGGVFLFDNDSRDFLESWHLKTMEIFKDPKWKTRDQGTLIATAWEFGLQEAETIPIEFNFLADFHHPDIIYLGGLSFKFRNKEGVIKPHFLHIYHEWGNENWELWRDVQKFTTSQMHTV